MKNMFFNLIVVNDPSEIDGFGQPTFSITLPTYRFLEHTNEEIYNNFREAIDNFLYEIKYYPTIIAFEKLKIFNYFSKNH